MKVLFAASEAVPFAKTGGLADVVGSLPKYLRKKGIDVRIIMPKYGDIPAHLKEELVCQHTMLVPVGWRKQYCGIEKITYHGMPVYFVDNEYYFKRTGLYGFYDEAERYAFFCRAVLEALPYMQFMPHILHCHDWHSGMISVFLKAFYRDKPDYGQIKTIFSIHNLKYQGIFSKEILGDLLGLGDEYFTIDGIEFYNNVSYMKGGLVYSDVITTVSDTYAWEIQTPYLGENLDGLLRYRSKDLYGILNGIDYEEYNPANDTLIYEKYNETSLEKKLENKYQLQQFLGLPVRQDVPLVAIISRLVSQKGLDLIARVLDEILAFDIQLVVLGTGEEIYENMFRDAASRFPQKVFTGIYFDNTLAHRIYAGSDITLMPSLFEPCGLTQLIALRYGSLPIVRETGGLKDTVYSYNELTGKGNGFSFANYNAHDMLYTIGRAVNLYKYRDIWQLIVKEAMTNDYSWHSSVQKYLFLYRQLCKKD